MSDLSPTRPLPWKAVSYGGDDPSNRIWDVVNDHGDPQEEFSVLEYATEGEARFIVRACNCHADLLRYAELEAEYTALCDRRRPDWSPFALMAWVEANGIGNEPVGAWLGRIRAEAIAKAKGGTK